MQTLEFGWLPELHPYEGAVFKIEPILSDREQFNYIVNSLRTKDGWFYPPLEPEYVAAAGNTEPLIYTDLFALPPTHRLCLRTDDSEIGKLAAFVIEALG